MNRFIANRPIEDTKVVVAMSGGVDSSVVAAMLHHEGYQVIGVTMQLYDHGLALEKKGACCAGKDIYDAKNVADRMGFPHYVLNYENVFKEEVMEDFADSYLRGQTPIPCVRCNQSVKFRDLVKMARDLNADALATGHYIRRVVKNGKAELHKAIDHSKDQSYFLFATTQEQLDYVHFPLGGMHKEETRKLAESFGLDVADKPDSQDICFVPDGNYSKVIERLRPGALDKGDIMHVNGDKLGEHEGIIHFTIGQRKGLGISSSEPLYVVKIDAESNKVIVGPKEALGEKEFIIKELNWLGDSSPTSEDAIRVKLRSTHQEVEARFEPVDEQYTKVILKAPQHAITPGQACVAYLGERVLGGGWIDLPQK